MLPSFYGNVLKICVINSGDLSKMLQGSEELGERTENTGKFPLAKDIGKLEITSLTH
jgi:hypothetical protein